jgi:hypothetical protein
MSIHFRDTYRVVPPQINDFRESKSLPCRECGVVSKVAWRPYCAEHSPYVKDLLERMEAFVGELD